MATVPEIKDFIREEANTRIRELNSDIVGIKDTISKAKESLVETYVLLDDLDVNDCIKSLEKLLAEGKQSALSIIELLPDDIFETLYDEGIVVHDDEFWREYIEEVIQRTLERNGKDIID